jgi:L-alanine-DL-glutamate epimerase-like enolase superfamily enzyme
MQIELSRVNWLFSSIFRIAYQVQTYAEAVQVSLREGPIVGRGEALGVSYHGETVDSMLAQIAGVANEIAHGISRDDLQSLLPAGGARNALDCALWDLEAKRTGRRVWELAGIGSVSPLVTDYTLSLDTPASMARAAAAVPQYTLLKLKLDGSGDVDRVAAVRVARPDVRIIVDANQSWKVEHLDEVIPKLAELGVELIEQPLPVGRDAALTGFRSPIPLCADESCQTRLSLPSVLGKYQFINVKLDKTGGLTEALALAREAQSQSLKLMVGCMAGSSLSMAPAFTVGQLCTFADLDGPLLCSTDVSHPIRYQGSRMYPPERALWG